MGLLSINHHLFHELGDQRFKDNFLTHTPWLVLTILLLYYFFCRFWGPKFMENREPYDVKRAMTIYNIVQIMWNSYMFSQSRVVYPYLISTVSDGYCYPMDVTFSPAGLFFRYGATLYFYNKLFDLLDTIFMVLRKKNRQISTLHLSHHMLMAAGTWVAMKYNTGGNIGAGFLFNALIHVFMYTYYQLSLMGCEWIRVWKRHLTMLQMAQFGLVFLKVLPVYFDKNFCRNNIYISILVSSYSVYFMYAFSKFYMKTYLHSDRKPWDERNAACKERVKKIHLRINERFSKSRLHLVPQSQ